MTRIVLAALAVTGAFALSYAGTAFVLWQANPALWGADGRFASVFMGLFLCVPAAGAVFATTQQ